MEFTVLVEQKQKIFLPEFLYCISLMMYWDIQYENTGKPIFCTCSTGTVNSIMKPNYSFL